MRAWVRARARTVKSLSIYEARYGVVLGDRRGRRTDRGCKSLKVTHSLARERIAPPTRTRHVDFKRAPIRSMRVADGPLLYSSNNNNNYIVNVHVTRRSITILLYEDARPTKNTSTRPRSVPSRLCRPKYTRVTRASYIFIDGPLYSEILITIINMICVP